MLNKVKPKRGLLARIKYVITNEVPPCESYKSWTDYGYEYDCGYDGELECENCICAGGKFDP